VKKRSMLVFDSSELLNDSPTIEGSTIALCGHDNSLLILLGESDPAKNATEFNLLRTLTKMFEEYGEQYGNGRLTPLEATLLVEYWLADISRTPRVNELRRLMRVCAKTV
jgi:hypothetical protein